MNVKRIAIIGTGLISHRHMRTWSKISGVEVVAGCDINDKVLQEWGQKWNVTDLYHDFRELLARDDIDAVDVCLHNNLHASMSLAVMKAGKDCYCEKPMAGTYADAKLMFDAAKKLNRKLAIQISSIFNLQSRMARDMIAGGELGKVYHMRSTGERRRGRPGLDFKDGFSVDFFSKEMAGCGALFDMGVYHISQLLFVTGIPKLKYVMGATYQEVEIEKSLLEGKEFGVEELGVGLAMYENGLTLDIIESWAMNIDTLGDTFVAGSKGGLKFFNVDSQGMPLGLTDDSPFHGPERQPRLQYFHIKDGNQLDTELHVATNSDYEISKNPSIQLYNDNQAHWLAYLNGELTNETRYDTPYLAMQTMLVSEGICLSQALGRSVCTDEIAAMSKSTALQKQETDWGVFTYDLSI